MLIHEYRDYRKILRDRLDARILRNRGYSLRAFARDLGISPSRLSEILSGRHTLSAAKAASVAGRLGLSTEEQVYFTDLAAAEAGSGVAARSAAKDRLERFRSTAAGDTLAPDRFALVSRWWHFALLELTKTRGFRPTIAWLATSLGIPRADAKSAVGRLIRLGFLERRGKGLLLRKPKTSTRSPTPSAAIRNYHHEIIAKAGQAVEFQSYDERDLSSVVMAVDAARLTEARRRIDDFRKEFAATFAAQEGATGVYCLAIQYFRLDTGGERARPADLTGNTGKS